MRPIPTDRLLLRPLVRADFRALHSLYGNEELMEFITGRARTKWETRARLAKDLRLHSTFGFGLCLGLLREGGDVVGRYGLEPRPRPEGLEGELAWMTKQDFRGRGLATEAGRALVDFGIDELRLHRVFADIRRDNLGSVLVAERLGLVLEPGGGDDLRYSLSRVAHGPA